MAHATRAVAHDPIVARPALCALARRCVGGAPSGSGAFDLDLFDGEAWLGVVPVPHDERWSAGDTGAAWISAFPELNVRTYVRVADRPGVYFFSLDAGRRLAVAAARALLNLPYYSAAMSVDRVMLPCTTECTSTGARAIQGDVRTCQRSIRRGRGSISTSSPSGTVCTITTARASLPPRDSPPAVVPPGRTCDDHDEHDGCCQSPDAQRRPRAVALRTASRRGRLGPDPFVRRPSPERAERHRVAQVDDCGM